MCILACMHKYTLNNSCSIPGVKISKIKGFMLGFLLILILLPVVFRGDFLFADSGGGMTISPDVGASTHDIILTALPNDATFFDFLILYNLTTNSSAMPPECSEVHAIPFNLANYGDSLPQSIGSLTFGYACNAVGTYRLIVGRSSENWGNCVNSPNTLASCMNSGAVLGYADYTISPIYKKINIDIKPNSDPNSINIKSSGRIPVAILAGEGFDPVAEVDKGSLTFGRTGDEGSLDFCSEVGEDVNGDGLLDLVCHFKTGLAGFAPDSAEGILKGKTTDSSTIEGRDSVKIVSKNNLFQTLLNWFEGN